MSDQSLEKRINLAPGEEIVRVVRRSLWLWFWRIFFSVVLILVPFFFIYPLFQLGWWGLGIFAAVLIFGLILVFSVYLRYHATAFVLTNQRIVDLDGRAMTSALYSKIQDVESFSGGVGDALMKKGDIYINISGDRGAKIKLSGIKNSQKLVSEILSQQEASLSTNYQGRLKEAQAVISKLKNKLGEAEFNRLVND